MALPKTTDPNFPNIGGKAFLGEADSSNQVTMAAGNYYKDADEWTEVSEATPMPTRLVGDNVEDDGAVRANFSYALSKDLDSIDMGKMSKGAVTTAHNAIDATATSAEIDCRGFNGILVEASISAAFNWTFKLQGCMVSGGTFVDWYEMANTGAMTLMSYQCNASRGWVWKGIPDYVKIVATENASGATATVKVQPVNL
jgi:hypothetical protein